MLIFLASRFIFEVNISSSVFVFVMGSYVSWATLELSKRPRMTLNSYLYLPVAGIIICATTPSFIQGWRLNPGFCAC